MCHCVCTLVEPHSFTNVSALHCGAVRRFILPVSPALGALSAAIGHVSLTNLALFAQLTDSMCPAPPATKAAPKVEAKVPKKRVKKDKDAPKKPMPPFFCYQAARRDPLKKEQPTAKNTDLIKVRKRIIDVPGRLNSLSRICGLGFTLIAPMAPDQSDRSSKNSSLFVIAICVLSSHDQIKGQTVYVIDLILN